MSTELISFFSGAATTSTSGIAVSDKDQPFRIQDIKMDTGGLNYDDGTFYRFLNILGTEESTDQVEFTIVEDDAEPHGVKVSVAMSSSDTTLTLEGNDIYQIVKNTRLVYAETGEALFCTAAPTYGSGTVTVVRGHGNTGAWAIPAGAKLIPMTDSLGEEADANEGNSSIPTYRRNYCSNYSQTVNVTGLQQASMMESSVGQIPRAVVRKALAANRKLNSEFLWSPKFASTSPSGAALGTAYHTAGFYHQVSQHFLDLSGNNGLLEWPILNQFLRPMFDHSASSQAKMLVAGSTLFHACSRMAWDRYRLPTEVDEELGCSFTSFMTDGGHKLYVIEDRRGFDAKQGVSGWGFIVDPAHVRKRVFIPMQWRQNIQDNDAHNRKDEVFGCEGFELKYDGCHGIIAKASGQY